MMDTSDTEEEAETDGEGLYLLAIDLVNFNCPRLSLEANSLEESSSSKIPGTLEVALSLSVFEASLFPSWKLT